ESPRHRSLEREDRYLAFPGVRSDALWRSFLGVHLFADRRSPWHVAAWPAERSSRHNEHCDPDHVVSDSGAGLGVTEDAKISRLLVVHAGHDFVRRDFLDRQTRL